MSVSHIQFVAGVLAVVVIIIIIMRRRNKTSK